MALKIKTIASGGAFFKGDDYASAIALLLEVKRLELQLPTNYGPKDTITADITAFATVDDIVSGNATVTRGVKIQQVDLARKLADHVGEAVVVTVVKLEPTAKLPNGAWVWRQVDGDIVSKVVAYTEVLEAAEAAALDEVPDFS